MSDVASTAVVLCGGLGTRLRSVVGDTPKALAPVGGQPFLSYLLRFLTDQDIRDIILCTGFGSDQIAAFCGDGSRWGAHVRISQEMVPLGTAGAIRNARHLVESTRFFVLNGDSFLHVNLASVDAFHREHAARITMVLTEVPEQGRFGSVDIAPDGSVVGFVEKGASGPGRINAGIYLMEAAILEEVPDGFVSLEHDVLPRQVGHGLFGTTIHAPFIDIGTPESFDLAPAVLPKEWQTCPGL